MRNVTFEEYKEIKDIVNKEMTLLAKHENKNSYYGQIAINSCYSRMLSDNLQLF